MFIVSICGFISAFVSKFAFGVVGENITMKMRRALYGALVKKHLGWFDIRENSPELLS